MLGQGFGERNASFRGCKVPGLQDARPAPFSRTCGWVGFSDDSASERPGRRLVVPPQPPGLTDCGERWGEPRAGVPGGTPVWEVGIARAPGPRLPRRRRTIVPGSLSQLQSETFLHPPPPEPGLGVTFGTISAKKSAPDRRFCDSMEMKRH